MPFTLSHAAAVLPALRLDGSARGPLVASGLVLGSFAADVPYFLGQFQFSRLTHGLVGVLTIDLLITAALFGLWLVVREPVVALLPDRWQGPAWAVVGRRCPRAQGMRAKAAVVVWFCASAALGAASHVFLDAFTHAGRWGVRMFPLLDDPIAGRPVFSYLQHAGSIVGLFALGVFCVLALRRNRAVARPDGIPVLTSSARLLALGLIGGCVLLSLWRIDLAEPIELVVVNAAFAGGAGLGCGLLVYALGIRVLGRSR